MTEELANGQISDPIRALDQVCSWLSGLGISIEKNRLSTYRKAFQVVAANKQPKTIPQISAELSLAEAANAFHEVGELFHVWRGLKSIDDQILRQKLAKVVAGPPRLSDERPNLVSLEILCSNS